MQNKQTCKTQFGKFRIKLEDKNIYVGGRNFCVNIVLNEFDTQLYWLKTEEGGCELNEKEIRGDNTIKMVDLAFSLLRIQPPRLNSLYNRLDDYKRKYYQNIKRSEVLLLDDSGFTWKNTKKDKKYKTNFLKGYLLIHRKTWYEEKFNAVMCNPEIYLKYREKANKNFDDPSKKPETFNFINSEAKEKLEPLYKKSTTWGEFINKFVGKYDKEKYKLMYEWYRYAIYIIFDGVEINQDWKIDISKRPYIECGLEGGKTRKNRRITFSNYNRLEPWNK